MVNGDLNLCHELCIELINSSNLPTDLKLETIQVMATIVPLDQGLGYLEDGLRIVEDKIREEPDELLWLGLLLTTRELIWRIAKFQGAIKFHREIAFGDPHAATRHRDFEKRGVLVKKRVQFQDEQIQGGDHVKKILPIQDETVQLEVYGPNRYVVGGRQILRSSKANIFKKTDESIKYPEDAISCTLAT
jgi:hypothetical protein